jgi:hypothetical protein
LVSIVATPPVLIPIGREVSKFPPAWSVPVLKLIPADGSPRFASSVTRSVPALMAVPNW